MHRHLFNFYSCPKIPVLSSIKLPNICPIFVVPCFAVPQRTTQMIGGSPVDHVLGCFGLPEMLCLIVGVLLNDHFPMTSVETGHV